MLASPSAKDAASDVVLGKAHAVVPTAGGKRNWLIGTGGDVEGKTFHIGDRKGTIGRGAGNFVQTTDTDASRVHCQFSPAPYGLEIKDTGSSNGTLVNGKKIQAAILHEGDEVQIGEARFVYRAVGDFGVDFGVQARKAVGQKTANPTRMGSPMDLKEMLRGALMDSDGDIDKAAAKLDMKPELFKAMLHQYEVDTGGTQKHRP